MRVLPCGDAALLLEVTGPGDDAEGGRDDAVDAVLALADAVRGATSGDATVLDVVPAARTVLVTVEPGTPLDPLRDRLSRLRSAPGGGGRRADADVVELTVRYDGPDLDDVAALTGLTVDAVVAAHTGTLWRVAFGGFAPGFAYLVGGDPRLVVPRREEPRTRVPAGAVGLAGTYSGVYPRPSPGGWQLLGRTDAVLWDVDRDPPALLRPGAAVRFVSADR
ncbi:5-oxoprolinase subunit B family protein [Thalassiella azotivora]